MGKLSAGRGMSTPVRRDQFKLAPKGIVHLPTGAAYIPHPGAPYVGTMNPNQLGNVLPNGEDYRPHEVKAIGKLNGCLGFAVYRIDVLAGTETCLPAPYGPLISN